MNNSISPEELVSKYWYKGVTLFSIKINIHLYLGSAIQLSIFGVDNMEIVGCLNTNELRDLPTQFHLELDVTSEMASGSNLNHKHHRKVPSL